MGGKGKQRLLRHQMESILLADTPVLIGFVGICEVLVGGKGLHPLGLRAPPAPQQTQTSLSSSSSKANSPGLNLVLSWRQRTRTGERKQNTTVVTRIEINS